MNMVKEFTNGTPLFASRQYQIWVILEVHTDIWILRINHLLTIKPPEEGIRKRNLRLTSMFRHVINPSLHTWFSR